MSYEPPKQQAGGCGEVWVLTRAVFAVLLGPLLAVVGAIAWLIITLYAFFTSPPLALIPIAIGAAIIAWYVWWDRRRSPPVE
jgi:hypothetical protein